VPNIDGESTEDDMPTAAT